MTKAVAVNGKVYEIKDGRVIVDGRTLEVAFAKPCSSAPKGLLAQVDPAILVGRVWTGSTLMPAEVANAALQMQDEMREAREATLRANVPGLDELRSAISEWADYDCALRRMQDDEYSVVLPSKPTVDVEALRERYPVASAYLKAEAYTYASDDRKVAAGQKAVERLEGGEDHAEVIAEMESEWSAAARESVWNN